MIGGWEQWRITGKCVVALIGLSIYSPFPCQGNVTLPQVFQSHMVLQRDQPLPIWGTADSGEVVTVAFGESTRRTIANEAGQWRVTLPAQRTSARPQSLHVRGQNRIELTDVLVGEVWLCAGQSNMEWPLSKVHDAKREIAGADYPNLRLLYLRGAARGGSGDYTPEHVERLVPEKFCRGSWKRCTSETARDFSAVGYFFGERLIRELEVPIGLICPAIGGTPTEAWVRREAMAAHTKLHALVRGDWLTNPQLEPWCQMRARSNLRRALAENQSIPDDDLGPNHSFKPGFMWKAGVAPLVPLAIRGVVWYQGESNAQSPRRVAQHETLFPLLVRDWRSQWQQGEFPFIFVQLPGLERADWPAFRNGQRRMLDVLPNTGMAVTIDLGHPNNVHPGDKRPVGERLAQWALARTYRRGMTAGGPLFSSAKQVESTLLLAFKNVGAGLQSSDDKPMRHFEVAGDDGVFHEAEAKVVGTQVVVRAAEVALPRHVRYASQLYPRPAVNFYNADGLPASPFSWSATSDSSRGE